MYTVAAVDCSMFKTNICNKITIRNSTECFCCCCILEGNLDSVSGVGGLEELNLTAGADGCVVYGM
jgi:hypothetical protein